MKVTREHVERHQVIIYLIAVVAGGTAGCSLPGIGGDVELVLWSVLAMLLYATFCQTTFTETLKAFLYRRFFVASLVTNFTLVPVMVWLLSLPLLSDPATRLGVLMVLLVPCTDWFVTFTHLGKGSTRLAVALVPVQLLVQLILLPLYLWLFVGSDFVQVVAAGPFLHAFVWVILLPFILANLTRVLATRSAAVMSWLRVTQWLPVPLLALVMFLIVLTQAVETIQHLTSFGLASLVFVLYLAMAIPLARYAARLFRLSPDAGRTLAFNLSTRNSFVVLPLALALPPGWDSAATVIVLQTLIELTAMIVYVPLVPGRVFPESPRR